MPRRISTEHGKLVAERYQEARRRLGFDSDLAFATAHGIDNGRLNKWINRKEAPSGYYLVRLAFALNVNAGWLVGLDEEAGAVETLCSNAGVVLGPDAATLLRAYADSSPGQRATAMKILPAVLSAPSDDPPSSGRFHQNRKR